MHSYDAAVLRAAAAPVAGAVAASVVVAAALDGGRGALGAAIAGVVVSLVFAATGWLCSRTRALPPTTASAVAVSSYIGKVVVLGIVLAVFGNSGMLASNAFPLTLIVVTTAWMAAEVRAFTTVPTFYVEPVRTAGSAS